MKHDTLVFEGGAIHGIAYSGILEQISKRDIEYINTFVGTSFGSIIAGFLAMGISPIQLSQELLITDYSKFLQGNMFTKMYGLFSKRKSMYDSKYFRMELIKIMKKFGIDPNIKFGDLEYDLFVTVTNITMDREETFNTYKTPSMKVIDGMVASSSIPLVFQPFKYAEQLYVDGGLVENYNIDQIKKGSTSLGFVLGDKKSELKEINKISGIYSYVVAIFKTLINTANKKHIDNNLWNDNTVFIDIPKDIDSMNFNISNGDMLRLYQAGKDTKFMIKKNG